MTRDYMTSEACEIGKISRYAKQQGISCHEAERKLRRPSTRTTLPGLRIDTAQVPLSAADVILDSALRDWWEARSNHGDRYRLLRNLGLNQRQRFHYAAWRWDKLPDPIRRFVVQHSLSGKPLDFLEDK